MHELRQPSTPFEVANVTLDDTVVVNENRQEADYHMMTGGLGLAEYDMVTGPTKNILRQSSKKTNITNTLGQNAEHLFHKHPEPPDSHSLSAFSRFPGWLLAIFSSSPASEMTGPP